MAKYDHLIGTELASGSWSWDSDRALLYAVGVGVGLDDAQRELHFSTENAPGQPQQVIPTFATVMVLPDQLSELMGWTKEGLTPIGMVHGEQSVTLARPLPIEGTANLRVVLTGIYDKGSGALVVIETTLMLADTEEPLGTTVMKLFVKDQGGFGGPRGPANETSWRRPEREPDQVVSLPVGSNQSLIYRLSGDRHPHGTQIPRARADGFDRPIYLGLGTFGVACRALLRGLCKCDATRFEHIEGRFSKPVYPGDRLDTLIWQEEEGVRYQVLANGDQIVIDRGVFRYR